VTITIRATEPDELRLASAATRVALLDGAPDDDAWAKVESSWLDQISFSAWDGEQCVGHASSFDVDTFVPGGAWLPSAAVTRVGVLPTHRRQGIFTRLMERVADDARERGRVIASLRASESTIYHRMGYGMAGFATGARIDVVRAKPLGTPPVGGTFRLLAPDAAIHEVVRDIYERAAHRPGAISRPQWLVERYFEEAVDPHKANHVVVHTSPDGVDDGYAQYEVKWTGGPLGTDVGEGTVNEVRGVSPQVELALWKYLLDVDLVRTWTIEEFALDDPLSVVADDSRAVMLEGRFDEQWLRLLDVDAALTARSWAAARPVTVEVSGAGTWSIGDGIATRSDSAPDLSCDRTTLSAAYLGATSWWELAAAGRVVGDAKAVAAADAVFSVRPLAFCGSFF
jgi:predicted acetyltransferase